jgi:hypothetical protein
MTGVFVIFVFFVFAIAELFCCFCGTRNGTQGLTEVRQALYYWAISSTLKSEVFYSKSISSLRSI